jgi:hypothetical protein
MDTPQPKGGRRWADSPAARVVAVLIGALLIGLGALSPEFANVARLVICYGN